jgi:hypothetical protein
LLGGTTTIARLRRSLCLDLGATAMQVLTLDFSRKFDKHEKVHGETPCVNRSSRKDSSRDTEKKQVHPRRTCRGASDTKDLYA